MLLLIGFLVAAADSTAGKREENPLRFSSITTRDGLANRQVRVLLEDRFGFMWMGTHSGLNRYDGHGFKVYREGFGENELADDFITAMIETEDGTLWIGTRTGGLHRFERERDHFIRVDTRSERAEIWGLAQGAPNILWMATFDGLFRVYMDTGRMEPIGLDHGFSGHRTLAIHADKEVWVGSDSGLHRLDSKRDRFVAEPLEPGSIENATVYRLGADPAGIWYSGRGFMVQRNLANGETRRLDMGSRPLPATDTLPWDFLTDSRGNRWLTTLNGHLWLKRPHDQQWHKVEADHSDPNSLLHNTVYDIFEDRNGTLWFGTDHGVSVLRPVRLPFSTIRTKDKTRAILDICEDDEGNLWFSSNEGLQQFNWETGVEVDYRNHGDLDPHLKGQRIFEVERGPEGLIWANVWQRGIYSIDPASEKIVSQFPFGKGVMEPGDLSIYSMVPDHNGLLWLGTNSGLERWDTRRGEIERYDGLEIGQMFVKSVLKDQDGSIWIGTYNGDLLHFDPQSNQSRAYRGNSSSPGSLPDDAIEGMVEDTLGRIWVATNNSGLYSLNPETGVVSTYRVKDGLLDESIYRLAVDGRNRIWMSYHRGISYLEPETGAVRHFDARDGLFEGCVSSSSVGKTRGGDLMFSGDGGFTRFNPNHIKSENLTPEPMMTDVLIGNKPALFGVAGSPLDGPPEQMRSLTISPDQGQFSLVFATPGFPTPEKLRYAYKMDGLQQNWIETTASNRIAHFNEMPHGTYTFKVKAATLDGDWHDRVLSVPVRILPSFWETLWFRGLLVISGLALLFGLHRLRMNQVLAVERLRTGIAADLHDDIGGLLTRIAMGAEVVGLTATQPDRVRNKAGEIGNVAREAIRSFSDIVWSLDARNDTTDHLIARIAELANATLSTISHRFSHDGFSEDRPLAPLLRQNLYLICKEALHNAIKHAGADEVVIDLKREDNLIRLDIADNGCGLKETASRVGHGLRNMRLRAEKISGTLQLESAAGLRITVTVPAG